MAENKDSVYVYTKGPSGKLCRVPLNKLARFEENKAKVLRGEKTMTDEEREQKVEEALAHLKKLAGRG